MRPIISITDLKFQNILGYPQIQILPGKITFLSGESGCGKSTLLKLLNGTLTPSGGTIEYDGNNISDIDTIRLRSEVLLASQEVYLFDGTIKENFEQYYNFRDTSCIEEESMQKFLLLCCADFPLDTKCELMSGGERQRIFIAINLSFMPKVLLLDEPTAALDDTTAIRLFAQLKDFCLLKGMTLIIVCHNEKLVEKFADHRIVLEKKVKS